MRPEIGISNGQWDAFVVSTRPGYAADSGGRGDHNAGRNVRDVALTQSVNPMAMRWQAAWRVVVRRLSSELNMSQAAFWERHSEITLYIYAFTYSVHRY